MIICQPEQTPFSLADGWTWLATVINTCKFSKPPFFTASILEVFLRITSPHLLKKYKDVFLSLLECIQSDILPLLPADMPKKVSLTEFLQRFINSKGNDFMSLFQNRDN